MKKMLSILLAMMLLVGLTTAATAAEEVPEDALAMETYFLEDYGMLLDVPEGMELEDVSQDPSVAINLLIKNDILQYLLALTYDETMAGQTLADLDEEMIAAIEATLTAQIEGAIVTYEEEELTGEEEEGTIPQTYLVATNEEFTMLLMALMDDGELMVFSAAKANGEALTEEEIMQFYAIMDSIAYEDIEEDIEEEEA